MLFDRLSWCDFLSFRMKWWNFSGLQFSFFATSCCEFPFINLKAILFLWFFLVYIEHKKEKVELYLKFLKSINHPSPLHLPPSLVILHRLSCPRALATESSRAVSGFTALISIQAWQLIDYEWFKQPTDRGQAENSKHAKWKPATVMHRSGVIISGWIFMIPVCDTSHLLMCTPGVIAGLDMGFIYLDLSS